MTVHTPDGRYVVVGGRLPIKLERDVFLRSLIRELAGALQDVVGLDEAGGRPARQARTTDERK